MENLSIKQVLTNLGKDILNWVKSNCVNNCVSTTTNLPLAAAQGKALQDQITTLNSNITYKANMHREGYTKAPDIYIENRSALVIFGKQQYSQSSLLYYDSGTKNVQPLVNPSSDTFTVTILSDGRVKITAINAVYSNKAAIYMD